VGGYKGAGYFVACYNAIHKFRIVKKKTRGEKKNKNKKTPFSFILLRWKLNGCHTLARGHP
jgi:hypothetical protein